MKLKIITMKTPLILALSLVGITNSVQAQMSKRWIDRYNDFATTAPAVQTYAPDLCLWDLDGQPRSLKLEQGRTIILINGSFT